jgi:hypothetical protein
MAKMLKTSAEGRRCKFPHCTVILSIYNHEEYCRIHREQVVREDKTEPPCRPVSKAARIVR